MSLWLIFSNVDILNLLVFTFDIFNILIFLILNIFKGRKRWLKLELTKIRIKIHIVSWQTCWPTLKVPLFLALNPWTALGFWFGERVLGRPKRSLGSRSLYEYRHQQDRQHDSCLWTWTSPTYWWFYFKVLDIQLRALPLMLSTLVRIHLSPTGKEAPKAKTTARVNNIH